GQTRPSCLVNFGYKSQGIKIVTQGKLHEFPLFTMDWVEGDTLDRWLEGAAQKKDKAAIRTLADEWVKLMEELARCKIAHVDLQHGNIMVRCGKLMLVDYDGMLVPGLVGSEAFEAGLPGYQHPERKNQRFLSLEMDHFSAWIILISLRAVAADLSLYERFVI